MREIGHIFWRFLALGCTSFGGPAAHIGYFHRTFVDRLRWIDEAAYARLIALSQFLPGPGSSQVGFAIGLHRAGLPGGLAAFIGFTLPSFILLYLLAVYSVDYVHHLLFEGVASGLKLLAVVVVADAVLNMGSAFCKTRLHAGLAVLTAVSLLVLPALWMQFTALAFAALVGSRSGEGTAQSGSGGVNWLSLALFALLFVGMPLASSWAPGVELFARFYAAGSLVFGGGHVVLPLLQQSLGEAVSTERFLVGYAAAQAIPGPMFTLATFLGAEMTPTQPIYGALLATAGVFMPGFLLLLGLRKAWETLATKPRVAGAAAGINASVVGLLLATLYQPVFVNAVHGPREMAAVVAGFFILRRLGMPIALAVVAFALIGCALHLM